VAHLQLTDDDSGSFAVDWWWQWLICRWLMMKVVHLQVTDDDSGSSTGDWWWQWLVCRETGKNLSSSGA